jgi:hypothetical protein
MSQKITPKHSPKVRERAVRRVQEHRGEYPSLWAAHRVPFSSHCGEPSTGKVTVY